MPADQAETTSCAWRNEIASDRTSESGQLGRGDAALVDVLADARLVDARGADEAGEQPEGAAAGLERGVAGRLNLALARRSRR